MTAPSAPHFRFVDSQTNLDDLVDRLENCDRIAVDTEADSLHHYYEKVCLIQLSFSGESYVVDPLAKMNLQPFLDVLASKRLIFHGAEYDLRMLLASHGFHPHNEIFDTMLAAQLVEGEARSLVALAEQYADVELTKAGRRSDWSRRPLTDKQLAYAANDTRYLERIADQLESELERLNRLEWHRQSCGRMIKATGKDKPEPDPNREWRIKGLFGLDRKQLAFVRAIWYWRDGEARKADLPPFKVAGNGLIMDLVEHLSVGRGRLLENGPKLPRNCVGRRLEGLKAAIKGVLAMAEDDYPDYLRGGSYTVPEYGPELDKLRAECDRMARELGLESSLVASKKQLEQIVQARPTSREALQAAGHLMDWQTELLFPAVSSILVDA